MIQAANSMLFICGGTLGPAVVAASPLSVSPPVVIDLSAANSQDAALDLAGLLPTSRPALSVGRFGDSEELLAAAAQIIINDARNSGGKTRVAESGIAAAYPAAGSRATSGALSMFAAEVLEPAAEKDAEGADGADDQTPDVQKIAMALKESRGNIAKAARLAGISYAVLYRLMGKYEFRRSVQRILRRPEIVRRDARWKAGEEDMAEALARNGGRRDLAAWELGMKARTVGQHVKNAVPDSPLEDFQERPAVVKKNDEEIAAALALHGGSRTLAAIDLGITQSAVSSRVMSADRKSPLFKYVHVKDHPKLFEPRKNDEEIAAALRECDGDRTKAAKIIGMTPKAIRYRIWRCKSGVLAEFKTKKGKGGREPIRSDEEIIEGLEANGGNVSRTAVALGMSNSTLAQRLYGRSSLKLAIVLKKYSGNRQAAAKALGMSWNYLSRRISSARRGPLVEFRTLRGKAGPQFIRSEDEIAAALEASGGDRREAATILKMSYDTLAHRVWKSSGNSPLVKYKSGSGFFEQKRVEKIAAALRRHGGNRLEAARDLGMTESALRYHIKSASHGPLVEFKNLKGKTGTKAGRSDEEIAAALEASGGSRKAAAAALEMSYDTLVSRVWKSKGDSPLAKFK